MSPVSLLFSSDEEASRRVVQALHELELEVEPCPDIFTAVEWLTSRSFDVIVADWDCGPEAAFLLKNARELKLNRTAFTLALVNRTPNLAPEEDSPDQVLTKPLIPDQIKYALLSNERFLRCMRAWIERGDFAQGRGETPSAMSAENTNVAERRPSEQPSPMPLAAHPIMPSLAPDFAYAENGAPLRLTFRALDQRLSRSMNQWNGGQPSSGKLKRYVGSRFFRGIFAGLVFVAVGHILGQPLRVQSVFANAASVYREALKTKIRAPQASEDYAGANSATVAQAISRRAGSGKYPMARALAVPMQTMLPDQISPTPAQTLQADAHLDQNRLPATESRIQIPDSLKVPQPDDAVVHAASVKRSPSLLGQIEPVSLPEDLSKGLLLQKVPPSYPEQALQAGLQGAVVLQAWIGKDGRIRDLKLLDGSLLLGQAAVRAVKQWRYKPYVRNGVAVEAETYVTVNFNLPQVRTP